MARFMANGTLDEREAKWKECLLSVGKRCQVLRSGRALKPELLNPSSSCSDAETLALVPISNASEENTAAQSISTTQANVTLEVDKSLNVAQTPLQINLGLYSFHCHMSCKRLHARDGCTGGADCRGPLSLGKGGANFIIQSISQFGKAVSRHRCHNMPLNPSKGNVSPIGVRG
jgi:hypothetical protein